MQPLGGNTGSKYPYTIDVTSDIGELKQGFSVSVEVKIRVKAILGSFNKCRYRK